MEVPADAYVQEGVVLGVLPKGFSGTPSLKIGTNAKFFANCVLYANNGIGNNFVLGACATVREDNVIGNNVSIGSHANVEHHVIIEDDVRLHSFVFVPEFSVLKKGCWLGPRVTLTNAPFPLGKEVKERLVGPTIGEGAIIGANATILPGVNIGKRALVAAGSVVTKDVPDRAVVVGNPAKIVKTIDELSYKDGVKPYSED